MMSTDSVGAEDVAADCRRYEGGMTVKEARQPEIDKLRLMLKEAEIPFESIIQKMPQNMYEHRPFASEYGAAGIYDRNQVIYGRYATDFSSGWKFDAIWQYGSYGASEGLMETYGPLGVDKNGDPAVMTAEEAFKIIKKDWEQHGRADK